MNHNTIRAAALILKPDTDIMGEEEQKLLKVLYSNPEPITFSKMTDGIDLRGEATSVYIVTAEDLVKQGVAIIARHSDADHFALNPHLRHLVDVNVKLRATEKDPVS